MGLDNRETYRKFLDEQNRQFIRPAIQPSRNKKETLDSMGGLAWISLVFVIIGFWLNGGVDLTQYAEKIQSFTQTGTLAIIPSKPEPLAQRSPAQTASPRQVEPVRNYTIQPQIIAHSNSVAMRLNAEDNHRRVMEIQERERKCKYWRTNALNYEMETADFNIRQFCH
jgi:hypothetical protein